MNTELIERLRAMGRIFRLTEDQDFPAICDEAADAIEAAASENEALRKDAAISADECVVLEGLLKTANENKANINAELLEALIGMEEWASDQKWDDPEPIIIEVRAAIKKATSIP